VDRPFVAINCSAIPESLMESEIFGHEKGAFTGAAERRIGCFELAHGGTLLLDEIGEMPPPTQAKLLRVLEDHKVRRLGSKVETPVDVRVLAATNKNPEQAVADGHLRQDLYFRLNVFHIHLPPLREHKQDLPLLIDHLLEEISEKHGKKVAGVGADVMDLLRSYPWPGNVRELRNVVERLMLLAGVEGVTAETVGLVLPVAGGIALSSGGGSGPLAERVQGFEREAILAELKRSGYQITKAAKALGLERSHLYKKAEQLGIDIQKQRREDEAEA
jgi:transcriptional regulator with PAS, ATPase and Fis domain